MKKQTYLSQIDISSLVNCCAETTAKRDKTAPDYCFELFRRAIDAEDEMAWACLYTQYEKLVYSWVRRTCSANLDDGEVASLTQDAFLRFWQAMKRHNEPMTKRFQHTGELMRYWQQCTVSVVLDAQRKWTRRDRMKAHWQNQTSAVVVNFEENVVDQLEQGDLIERVGSWTQTNVVDEQEKLVLQFVYMEGLRADVIVARCPEVFPDTKVVRKVKQRLLKRMRRALCPQLA